MKRVVLVGVLLGALGHGGTAIASDPIALHTGQQGCVSRADDTCTYTTTRDAGYVASASTWTLTIEIAANGDARDTNLDGRLRYVFTTANAPERGCGLAAAGSTVTTAAGSGGSIAAGNPFRARPTP